MEKYERNIKIKRILTSIDTDNDGIDDTIAYINQEDLFLPILIKQSIKDLGVYTDIKPPKEVIDLGSFWDTDNSGYGDFGTNPISSGTTSDYDENTTNETGVGDFTITGCMDPTALNYSESATVQCGGCCDYGFDGDSSSTGFSDSTTPGPSGSGCYKIATGCKSTIADLPSNADLKTKAEQWCKATHSSCGTNYAIIDGCASNGCGAAQTTGCIANNPTYPTVIPNPCNCCPGPVNTQHLLTQIECVNEGFNCSGDFDSGCPCESDGDKIFGGIKTSTVGCVINEDTNGFRKIFKFFCVPD